MQKIYLAGSIRDNNGEDIGWRERAIHRLASKAILLNPLGAKQYDEKTKIWKLINVPSSGDLIFKQDAWCVDNCDIVLANLTCLVDGYPTIGSLLELGRAWGKGKLIYLIIPTGYKGHTNTKMYNLHPFLTGIAAHVFNDVPEALNFLYKYLDVLNGTNAHYQGGN